MKNVFLISAFLFFVSWSCEEKKTNFQANVAIPASSTVELLPLVENSISPVYLTHCGDDRIFIVSQNGIISIFQNGKLIPQPFLNIGSKIETGSGYSEKGLLGLAFHPQYKSNGRFFIYYSRKDKSKGLDHTTVLAEYKVSPSNPNQALTQEKILLEIPQPESNHNGGQLAFGPDGFLYIGSGDGGGAGDKHGKTGNAQNLENLLGKILRIDVNTGNPYGIPKDNPFAHGINAKPEIYAYGFRNPWRFSFDKKDGKLFCGDVGQNQFEEIDIVENGKNYGWRAMEGKNIFDKELVKEGMVAPIHDYPRSAGISVIGGYVYRGKKYPDWNGKYFFADWNGKIYYLEQTETNWVRRSAFLGLGPGFTINSLGEDVNGELYILGQKETGPESKSGMIYKLIVKP